MAPILTSSSNHFVENQKDSASDANLAIFGVGKILSINSTRIVGTLIKSFIVVEVFVGLTPQAIKGRVLL